MKYRVLFLTALLLLLTTSLYAKSKNKDKQNTENSYSEENDMSLIEIDRLIRKTDYGEALRQLKIYIDNKPENFDNAQRRIKRIMNIRKQYSILAEKLINLILTEPENDKEIYEITAQLERFERNPSDENLKFIADLKKSAEFNYFRAKFNEVLNTSSTLTKNGQYSEAISFVRTEGFWLYQEDFYQKWEDNEALLKSVDDVVAHLDAQVILFNDRTFNNRLNRAVNDFVNAVNNDRYDEAVRAFATVDTTFKEYARIRNSIFDDAKKIMEIYAQVQKMDQDTTDASYLPFMYRFIFGIDSIPDSGVVGAIDGQWNALVGKMNTAVMSDVDKHYKNYFAVTENKKYTVEDKITAGAVSVTALSNYSSLENRCLSLYNYLELREAQVFVNPYEKSKVSAEYVAKLTSETTAAYQTETKLNKIKSDSDSDISAILSEQDAAQRSAIAKKLFDSCATIDSVVGVKNQRVIENVSWSQTYRANALKEYTNLENVYTNQINSVFVQSSSILNGVWQQLTQYYNQTSDELYALMQSYNTKSDLLRNGFQEKLSSDVHKRMLRDSAFAVSYDLPQASSAENQIKLNYSYPDVAYNVAVYTQNQIDTSVNTLTSYQNLIRQNYESHPQWLNDDGVTKLVNSCTQYLEQQKQKLLALKPETQRLASAAQDRMTQAQLARTEADMRFTEAETALKRENFTQARKKLQDALSKYDEALVASTDESLRSEWDAKLQELGERINRTENEIIVKEVRTLKTQARDAYFNGRFDDAEKYLNQAKIRWAVTNANEDEEITSLMNFVNTAISMQTGREILPSAPQYPEMSQLINIANQYFDSGSQKYKAGNKEDGNADLEKALESIQKVQYVYPLNQEASILTLKINQLKDPKKFDEEFAQKIQSARTLCKNASTAQEGYANLLDYYKLKPDYKGLKDLIYQVEIEIGVRQKPVDNSAQTRSKNIYNDAQKAYNSAGNNLTKLQSALDKANQALALNPNNTQAQALKDKIITQMGGTAAQISVDDERLYNQAIQYLQNNNVIAANQILQQLLSKPQNQYVQKIKDLKAKIDARM